MSKRPSPGSDAHAFVKFLRTIFPLLTVACLIACGGGSSTSKNIGGGGGGGGGQGSRTVNDMLFAADFNSLSSHAQGWCPTDSANNVAAITTLRIWDSGMKWADIETASGTFDWSNMDLTVNTLATNPNCTMGVIYTVGNTPPWASACAGQADPSPCLPGPTASGFGGGTQCAPGDGTFDFSCVPPSDVNSDGSGTDLQFQTFIATLVDRYAGKIAYYEVWNEADSPNFWCPDPSMSTTNPPSPSTCTGSLPRMVRMGWDLYNIIHCADPKAQVLSPSFHGFSAGPGGWMNLYSSQTSVSAPAGSITLPTSGKTCTWAANSNVVGKMTFDITNFHGRGSPTSNPAGFLAVYQAAVGEINRDNLPTPNNGFFDDENGYMGTADAPTVDSQAAYVAISYVLRASVTNPAISLSAWYAWDSPQGPLQGTNAGLAYDVVAGWLSGSTLTDGCAIVGTIYTCLGTTAAGKPFAIIWDMSFQQSCATTCATASQPLPSSGYTTWTDLTGTQNSVSGGTAPVGYKPILLE
jgi:hypothetical protein